ncbi:MAG TPA: GNAT family N-acetyltransferase [Actinomycetota bacterium]|jgi:CelD/BcsL family acetyltransferase involved in cellulose biosynthesis
MIRGEVLSDASDVARMSDAWTQLASANARPYCNPEWMLQWWSNVAPASARLHVVAVAEDDRVIGIAPFYADTERRGPVRYRLLGAGTSLRGDVLAEAGRETDVARAVAVALPSEGPAVIAFEGVSAGSAWPALLARHWPDAGASTAFREWSIQAPVLALDAPSFDEWLSTKSSNFRQQMRRGRTQLEKLGATFRMAGSEDELRSDLRAFSRLHRDRWAGRGGTNVLSAPVETMLVEAGRRMLDGRFRLWSLEIGDELVSSHLFLVAGGEVSYWLGGFDQRWARYKPSIQVLLAAIEDAWERGDARVDLGGGSQDYKLRFTDATERLDWVTVVPPGWRRPVTRAAVATVRARRKALSKLSPQLQARVRSLVRR